MENIGRKIRKREYTNKWRISEGKEGKYTVELGSAL